MEKGGEADEAKRQQPEKKGEKSDEEIPLESSPYLNYKDLEDYKNKAYGTEGHIQPKPGGGGGSTDAPTLSGDAASSAIDRAKDCPQKDI